MEQCKASRSTAFTFWAKSQILYVMLFFSGCATITSGTTQTIFVDTVNAPGANCKGIDTKGREYYWTNTPSSSWVHKGDGPLKITCEKPGFRETVFTVDEEISGAIVGNLIAGGLIGVLVDSASGAAQEYPSVVKFPMEPVDSAPEETKEQYTAAKRKLEEEALTGKNSNEQQGGELEKDPSQATSTVSVSSPQPTVVPASTPRPVDFNAVTLKIEEQLEQLRELHQKHLITEEDYQKAKKDVLRKLTE